MCRWSQKRLQRTGRHETSTQNRLADEGRYRWRINRRVAGDVVLLVARIQDRICCEVRDYIMSDTLINPVWQKYKLWIIGGGLAVLLILVATGYQACGDYWFNRGVDKDKEKIEETLKEKEALELEKEALERKIAEKQGELKVLVDNAVEAERLRLEAANSSNQAAANVNAIEQKDFNGTSLEESQRKRCAAFPDSPGCVK